MMSFLFRGGQVPIIEYFHHTKTYRVSVAKTVEWWTFVSCMKFPAAPYVPKIGVGVDLGLDAEIILETPVMKEALAKTAELWQEWANKKFEGVEHA